MSSASEQLINEVRLLYQSLVQMGDTIHAGRDISMGMRAVLEYLYRNGPSTVPHMARERRVTRQRIQSLVDSLRSQHLVAAEPNPASRRSPLIALTDAGFDTIKRMRRDEGRWMATDISEADLLSAATTLTELRHVLEARLGSRATD